MRVKTKIILLLILLLVVTGLCYVGYTFAVPNSILNEVVIVSKELKPGFAVNYLSENTYKNLGYGHCGIYVYLLQKELERKNLSSRVVGLRTTDNRSHSLLGVLQNNKWVLADPTIGIVYKNSFVEILQNPSLANNYFGDPIKDRGNYYGKDFFEKAYLISFVSIDYTTIPADYIKASINTKTQQNTVSLPVIITYDKTINISFKLPKGSRPLFISIISSHDFKIKNKNIGDNQFSPLLDKFSSKNILLRDKDFKNDTLSYSLEFNKENNDEKVTLATYFMDKRENIEKYIDIYAPLSSYISFTGGPVKVDSIEVLSNGKQIYTIDIGNSRMEKDNYRYIYADDYLGNTTPINGWGTIEYEGKISYRTAQYYPDSKNNYSIVTFIPRIKYNSIIKNTYIKIRYKKDNLTNQEQNSFVNIYDVKTKKYIPIGQLESVGDWKEISIPFNSQLIKNTFE
jgi:hypothetical protein